MKIMHLCRRFRPNLGGVETHVWEICQELSKKGHSVAVITMQVDASQPEFELLSGIEVIRIPREYNEKKWPIWNWMWRYRSIFQQADVVQIHDVFWWVLPILQLIKPKLWVTFHGWEGVYPVRMSAKFQRWLAALSARGTIHIGAWISEFYWDVPTLVMYGAPSVRAAELKSVKASNSLVFVGRLEPENDVRLYLQLIELLKNALPNLQVKWVGDGSLRSECQKVGEVVGEVQSVATEMVESQVVLASSYLSILDALALGKVVVSLYSHPLKQRYLETFPAFAQLVAGSDVRQVAQQLASLLEDENKLKQAQQAAIQSVSELRWQTCTDQYLELWQKK